MDAQKTICSTDGWTLDKSMSHDSWSGSNSNGTGHVRYWIPPITDISGSVGRDSIFTSLNAFDGRILIGDAKVLYTPGCSTLSLRSESFQTRWLSETSLPSLSSRNAKDTN